MNNIVFNTFDPFNDFEEHTNINCNDQIHIRQQMRNGKKCITIVEGLNENLDLKNLLKTLRKKLSTNGSITKDEDDKPIIQLQGNMKRLVSEFLIENNICTETQIKIHGL